ncbi:unnamed protein product [Symbiodinium sp. CCMP2592]|nr:unnamed protein product [Symbiodinium sp. CCMP2592]
MTGPCCNAILASAVFSSAVCSSLASSRGPCLMGEAAEDMEELGGRAEGRADGGGNRGGEAPAVQESLDTQLARLKQARKDLKESMKRATRALKSAKQKKQRLLKQARRLSDADLSEVVRMRLGG